MLGVFDSVDDATNAISEIIAAGIIPAALEMMDQGILVAVEAAFHFGFPLDAEAILLIEVDGLEAGLDAAARPDHRALHAARRPRSPPGPRRERAAAAVEVPQAGLWRRGPPEPQLLHAGRRRAAHQAAAHPAADHAKSAQKYDVRIVNVFHAGDGNIHPILLFDERDPEQVERVLAASGEILDECIACGGSVTGEHGIGVEKISFMRKLFTDDDLDAMTRLREAFNPHGRLSPGKMLPTAGACGLEQKHPGRRAAL